MADPQSNAALPAYQIPDDAPRSGVLHIRHRHTDRFTVVGNHLAQHPRLSAVAIGLAVHIQSLPDGASVTVKALTLRFPEGEITVRRALNELEAAGYLERRRVPLGGGRFATRTLAYDRPGTLPRPGKAVMPPTPSAPQRQPSLPPPAPAPPNDRHPRPDGSPAARPATGTATLPPVITARTPTISPAAGPATGPAADLLARLRLADPRLLLSVREIARLAPAVDAWLGRTATPAQITRTLTAALPSAPIHHPARFLEHRLATHLPPPLPAEPAPAVRPAPLITCDGCDRAFRTHDPTARCADCRAGAAEPSPRAAA
ncbi:hypothetical protein ACIGXA_39765 [Streptomyces fildesensis]|uniref:DNA-binding protein n=1 Tax=Streptomyces fildesensis TaxID=375757 RepID=A0ABW8CLK0_9ACTN